MRKTKDVCKENSAITLIALIITIIVLLILAGVTINAITGADSVLQKGKEAAEKNELGEIRDLIALGMNNILLESNAMQVDEYYKDVNSFITYGKINKEAYIIEDYEFDNPIVTGKISKNNGIGVEYEFEINISTRQIALQKSEKEILVESSMGYFKYSEPDENGNVKITGLTSATDVSAGGAFLGCKSVTKVKFTPGTGTVPDYSKNNYHRNTPWFISSNNGSNIEIKIDEGVTNIGEYTFNGCSNIKKIILPSTLNILNSTAFKGVTNSTNYYRGSQTDWEAIEGVDQSHITINQYNYTGD